MAKHRTVFISLISLLLLASLSVVYVELAFRPDNVQDGPNHLEIAEEWQREESRGRQNLAPRQAAGPGVGRVLAMNGARKSELKGNDVLIKSPPPEAAGSRAASLAVSPSDAPSRSEQPTVVHTSRNAMNSKAQQRIDSQNEAKRRALAQVEYQKQLAAQLNWTADVISSSSHFQDVKSKLDTLAALKQVELRLDAGTRELWWYLRDQLERVNTTNVASSPSASEKWKSQLLRSVKEQIDLLDLHATDIQQITDSYINNGWREKMFMELSGLMQRRLHHLQNPKDCASAKKLVCHVAKPCGFGCQIHHTAFCFILAYATERMLVVNTEGWRYADHWEAAFQPVSDNCTLSPATPVGSWMSYADPNPPQVIQAETVERMSYPHPAFKPMAVPRDLVDRLKAIHGYPFIWFIGQFLHYLMRPSDELRTYIETSQERMGIRHPIVGLHVRRSDKINQEASFHSIHEYMTQVEEWYAKRETQGLGVKEKGKKRAVYLATDDSHLIMEAQRKYPMYEFITDNSVSKMAESLRRRYSQDGLFGVILDVVMLSECDYIVCTFSSQVCRLAYELMQTRHMDASRDFYSLDDVYYFGGQQEHNLRAFHGYTEQGGGQVHFEKGDLLGIAGNEKNGFSVGLTRKTHKRGLFPSYKVEEEILVADFPTYPEVL